MIPVGFWKQQNIEDDERPDPSTLVDLDWQGHCEHLDWILSYIQGKLYDVVFLESYELGYSYCRFQTCPSTNPKDLGACTLTDGTYVWPEGLYHYVTLHHVKPPDDFLAFIESRYSTAPPSQATLQLYDVESQAPKPIPNAMRKWLTDHTTM